MILVSDLDGTLKREVITEADILAIKKFRSQGHLFGIATGRNMNSLNEQIRPYAEDMDFVIGTNGGIAQIGDEIFMEKISYEAIKSLLKFVAKYESTHMRISNGFTFTPPIMGEDYSIIEDFFGKNDIEINAAHIKRETQEQNWTIYQDLLAEDFTEVDFFYNNYFTGIVDVAKKGVSKSKAIQQICIDKLGFSKSDIFVIGNSLNDIPMVQDFYGFSVSDGEDELKKYATKLFPDVASCIEFLLS